DWVRPAEVRFGSEADAGSRPDSGRFFTGRWTELSRQGPAGQNRKVRVQVDIQPIWRQRFRSLISTRLFFCLPTGSSLPSGRVLGAIGRSPPKPCVVAVLATPWETSHVLTVIAR